MHIWKQVQSSSNQQQVQTMQTRFGWLNASEWWRVSLLRSANLASQPNWGAQEFGLNDTDTDTSPSSIQPNSAIRMASILVCVCVCVRLWGFQVKPDSRAIWNYCTEFLRTSNAEKDSNLRAQRSKQNANDHAHGHRASSFISSPPSQPCILSLFARRQIRCQVLNYIWLELDIIFGLDAAAATDAAHMMNPSGTSE